MTVIDVSQQLPGPYASGLLAAYGATVIKVEPPNGDPARRIDPEMFDMVNCGKRVLHLDLKSKAGVAQLHELILKADVFIEGFRPGVAARIGAGMEELARVNPALVYCSISGSGQEGPIAGLPVHDLNLQGLAGVRTGEGIGVPWVDLGTASMAALAIVSAWHKSTATGEGIYIDAAMLDTAVLWSRVKAAANERIEPTYGVFNTSDGLEVAIAVLEDHIWPRLCEALGWEDWAAQAAYTTYAGRVEDAELIRDRLSEACRGRTLEEMNALAVDYDLPITPAGIHIGPTATEHLALRDLQPGGERRVSTPLTTKLPTEGSP